MAISRKFSVLKYLALLVVIGAGSFAGRSQQSAPTAIQARLGEQLFRDTRFSTALGDLPASCSSCHMFDEDPQGRRAFADFLNRSWISFRGQSQQRFELRNSPALFDLDRMQHFHYDGEFNSLEALVKGTFGGRPMGWLPGEQGQAFTQVRATVVGDSRYRSAFKAAYGVDIQPLATEELLNWVARAVADFMRTLRSPRKSPYDQFITSNRLPEAPQAGESPVDYGNRLLARIGELERTGAITLTSRFPAAAVAGLKTFMDSKTGNCVVCHAPPFFTDYSYHNLGISQAEYDDVHGSGAFLMLEIPGEGKAVRPEEKYRQFPTRNMPGNVDLGYWNYVSLTSPLRAQGESGSDFLNRMIGTMKTPGLRHLAYTQPYMHNGAYTTLPETIEELKRLSELARSGKVRSADSELGRITIKSSDIQTLVAFLNSLNEDLTLAYDPRTR